MTLWMATPTWMKAWWLVGFVAYIFLRVVEG